MVDRWQGSGGTNIRSPDFRFAVYPFLTEFISTSRTAAGGASGHFDLPFGPVYFRIMVLEPRVSKQQFLFTKAGDRKRGPFRMIFVTEN